MQDIDIIVTYSDASGTVRAMRVKSDNLSKSWVWKNPSDENDDGKESSKVFLYIIICHVVTLLFVLAHCTGLYILVLILIY